MCVGFKGVNARQLHGSVTCCRLMRPFSLAWRTRALVAVHRQLVRSLKRHLTDAYMRLRRRDVTSFGRRSGSRPFPRFLSRFWCRFIAALVRTKGISYCSVFVGFVRNFGTLTDACKAKLLIVIAVWNSIGTLMLLHVESEDVLLKAGWNLFSYKNVEHSMKCCKLKVESG